jgi:hypothetical protein
MTTTSTVSERKALGHVLQHLVTPLLMCLGMGLAYLGAFAHPAPHELPVAVVGRGASVEQLVDGIRHQAGDTLEVTTVADAEQARARLLDREIVGAYVPGDRPELLVAKAASPSDAQVSQELFVQVAALQDASLTVTDVTHLATGDPTGQGLFFFLAALSIGAYASVAAIGAAGGALRMRTRLAVTLVTSVVMTTIATVLAGPVFDVVTSHMAAIWGVGLLYSAGILTIGLGLHTFLKRWTTIAMMTLFVMLNFTSSGGVYAPDLQNGLFSTLHQVWNGAGFVEAIRGIAYLGGNDVARRVLTLTAWLVLGLLVVALAAVTEHRRHATTASVVESPDRSLEEELEEGEAVAV